jgi:hypothetical protein
MKQCKFISINSKLNNNSFKINTIYQYDKVGITSDKYLISIYDNKEHLTYLFLDVFEKNFIDVEEHRSKILNKVLNN